MKKIILAGLMLSTSCSFAERLYVGGQVGYNSVNHNYQPEFVQDTTITANTNHNGTGVTGGIFGGYGHCFGDNVYGGFELYYFGNNNSNSELISTSIDTSNIIRTFSANQKLKFSYGAAIKPGYYITQDILVYGALAFVRSKFSGNYAINYSNGTATSLGPFSQYASGWGFGGGAEVNLSLNTGIRLEFIHTRYTDYGISNFPDSAISARFKPNSNQINLGFVYSFGDGFIS